MWLDGLIFPLEEKLRNCHTNHIMHKVFSNLFDFIVKPEPASDRHEPASERPEPASKWPEPASERHEPAIARHEPASERPELAFERHEPASGRHEPASERLLRAPGLCEARTCLCKA